MGLNWLSLPENDVRDPVHRQRAAQRPAGPQRAVPRFRAGSHAHGAVPLRAGLGVRIERPGCDPFPQRDLGWSSYAVSRPTIERAVRRRVETFGDSYRAYMERTGRIFPSIR